MEKFEHGLAMYRVVTLKLPACGTKQKLAGYHGNPLGK